MQTENYRKRAVDVRRSARASLLEIRQARMARRSQILTEQDANFPEDHHLDTAVQPDVSVEEHLITSDPSVEEGRFSPADDRLAGPNTGQDEIDSLNELAVKNAALAEMPEHVTDDDVTDISEMPLKAGLDTRVTASDDWMRSELANLLGAGPGLIWMLAQCNVTTVTQLAQKDANELAAQLGVVGQIVNVGEWISFAQART